MDNRFENLKQLKEELGDEEKAKAKFEESIESDYIFTMNWEPTEVDTQGPDVKSYPVEGIVSKYFKDVDDVDTGELDISKLDTKLDADVIEKYKDYLIKTEKGYAFNTKGFLISNLILSEFMFD